ncbi:MAG: UDP-N-acetylmuramoyl-L-alanyl-D-glutamate--2,6-diaminopimelate ligase [Gammaproteobacteria bacterium]|nr:UDP-N-acetylmuramoyl-L-alanyl-D-glutamate--2,6-diaminopimelate ligase [Gammaproteobacteria bacterium]
MSGNTSQRHLSSLLEGLTEVSQDDDRTIDSVTQDSRKVSPGALFAAIVGDTVDGRDFIGEAVQKGASAVVYEAGAPHVAVTPEVPVLPIVGLKYQLGRIASRFFGEPSKELFVFGVTGTNGKSSFVHLSAQALEGLGCKCGVIGTLGSGRIGMLRPLAHTTPEAVSLQAELRGLVDADCGYVCLEVSSHGLIQGRVEGVAIDAAIFTNISHEHLDYHADMAAYMVAKSQLFKFPDLRYAIINKEDQYAPELLEHTTATECWTFGTNDGDVHTVSIKTRADGLNIVLNTPAGECVMVSGLLGRVNVENILAVVTALLALGWPLDDVVRVVAAARPVPGRMELFRGEACSPRVVVDYAHTPDALEKALSSVREHVTGRLWCVFGCGGDRDRAKRSLMGGVAERLADEVVLTDDNPRHESPAQIVEDILQGMQRSPRVIHRREQAIADTVRRAAKDDIVLVAGKGHEATQQVGDHKRALSDRKVVSEILSLAA